MGGRISGERVVGQGIVSRFFQVLRGVADQIVQEVLDVGMPVGRILRKRLESDPVQVFRNA